MTATDTPPLAQSCGGGVGGRSRNPADQAYHVGRALW
jgi:hypothetical protein